MESHVRDVMTRDVVSVRETAEYKDIIAVMRELRVSAFPVKIAVVRVLSDVAQMLLESAGAELEDITHDWARLHM
jgi:predicted transcriptional regulator